MRIEPNQLDQLLHPKFEDKALKEAKVIAKVYQHHQVQRVVKFISMLMM